jgi:hypothetical protein
MMSTIAPIPAIRSGPGRRREEDDNTPHGDSGKCADDEESEKHVKPEVHATTSSDCESADYGLLL